MGRERVKVRAIGKTLVVTVPQGILEEVPLKAGDHVFVEAIPPRRLSIAKEERAMPSVQRVELEIQALEARRDAIAAQIGYAIYQHNNSMPTEQGMEDPSVAELIMRKLERDRAQLEAEIAAKRLELYDVEPAALDVDRIVCFAAQLPTVAERVMAQAAIERALEGKGPARYTITAAPENLLWQVTITTREGVVRASLDVEDQNPEGIERRVREALDQG